MILREEIEHIFARLMREDSAHVQVGHFVVSVSIFDHISKLSLHTPVFDEYGFIPPSVRRVIGREKPFIRSPISTFPVIDEAQGTIYLHHVGELNHFDAEEFYHLLEEFCLQAEVWRSFLEGKGEPDLVRVVA